MIATRYDIDKSFDDEEQAVMALMVDVDSNSDSGNEFVDEEIEVLLD